MRVRRAQIEDLYARLSRMTLDERRKVTGIGPRRAEIILPGVALYRRALGMFAIDEMMVLQAGVREGIAVDLARRGVGKERWTLTAEQRDVVQRLAQRFGARMPHASKVAELAIALYSGLEPLHQLPPWCGRVLEAAAYLRNVGHFISATRHHKHSHYLVSNVDLPGFTESEQRLVALLCRYHRKSMPMPSHLEFTSRPDEERRLLGLLIPLLRLADALDRSRDQRVEGLRCFLGDETITIQLQNSAPANLECWAAMRNADIVRDAYHRGLVVASAAAPASLEEFDLKP
jgi:exopolyphosphatase/guanosine-5'-triphosphate,3'-diphosphate pyrophosphatase